LKSTFTILVLLGFLVLPSQGFAQDTEETPSATDASGVGSILEEIRGNPVVRSIEISGLQRLNRTSIRSRIYTQTGKPLNRTRVTADIRRIFKLNFFEDVKVGAKVHASGSGIVLVYRMQERRTIVALRYDIVGDAVDRLDIEKVVDLRRFAILDEAAIRKNLNKIKDLYIEEGHFLVETSYELKKASNNGVVVTLKVDEGAKVQVRHINIVGNKSLSTESVKEILATREGGYMSFLTSSGQFKRVHFDQDLQKIQFLYLKAGHIAAKVQEPIITISPDKEWMTIDIRIDEGPQYTMGTVDIALVGEAKDWLVPKKKLLRRTALKEKSLFDYQLMMEDINRIGDAYRDLGFANASVTYDYNLHPETKLVDFTYKIQRGEPVKFGRIIIKGNKSTRDKVIRREMKIAEGDKYSATGLKRSKQRIEVLGFFETVKVVPRPTASADRMDVEVTVKEKQTGTFQVGAGFSSLESFILTAQISKNNFLGRGQTLSAQMTLSGLRQLFSLSFFEPYFLDTRWTFAFDVFNFQEDFVDFTRMRTGGNLSWGYRLTDDLSLSLTYTLEEVDASLRRTDIEIQSLRQAGLTSSLRGTLSWDTRNNRLFPSKGQYTTLSIEHAAPWLGSENNFSRMIGRTRFYFPLFWDMVFKTNFTLGYVMSGDKEPIPLFERFFVGGIYTVRGYERNSIGEKLFITSTPEGSLTPITIGGDKEFVFNAELEIPIFLKMGIRGVLFFDAGRAWGVKEDVDINLRMALGFGFRWQSPVGPLRFEWGIPLLREEGEDPLVFEFTIGNSF
jgi:outer membrane protein insertion porin family